MPNLPSVKRMMDVLSIDRPTAKRVRAIMDGPRYTKLGTCGQCDTTDVEIVGVAGQKFGVSSGVYVCTKCAKTEPNRPLVGHETSGAETRLERIDTVLGNCGVEYIPAGHNEKSPAIYYSNTGDSYGATVLKIDGAFRLGCWGDWVERGNYD